MPARIRTHYNMRNPHQFVIPSIYYVYHGSNRISNLGPRIWNLVSYRLKVLNKASTQTELKGYRLKSM